MLQSVEHYDPPKKITIVLPVFLSLMLQSVEHEV